MGSNMCSLNLAIPVACRKRSLHSEGLHFVNPGCIAWHIHACFATSHGPHADRVCGRNRDRDEIGVRRCFEELVKRVYN